MLRRSPINITKSDAMLVFIVCCGPVSIEILFDSALKFVRNCRVKSWRFTSATVEFFLEKNMNEVSRCLEEELISLREAARYYNIPTLIISRR